MVDDKAAGGALKRAGAQCDAMTQSAPAAGAGREGSVLHAVLPPDVTVQATQAVPHRQRQQRDGGRRGELGIALEAEGLGALGPIADEARQLLGTIGRASCSDTVCQSVVLCGIAVTLNKK